jgi:hypothetical protein
VAGPAMHRGVALSQGTGGFYRLGSRHSSRVGEDEQDAVSTSPPPDCPPAPSGPTPCPHPPFIYRGIIRWVLACIIILACRSAPSSSLTPTPEQLVALCQDSFAEKRNRCFHSLRVLGPASPWQLGRACLLGTLDFTTNMVRG